MKKTSGKLRRLQLDRGLVELLKQPLSRPSSGWIKTIRTALGMTQTQLAKRMGVTPPTLNRLEKEEPTGSVTLKSLERAAAALQCRVVYFLIPEKGSLEETVKAQAHQVAQGAMEKVSSTMQLEGQEVNETYRSQMVQQLAEEMILQADKRIWE